MVEEAGAEEEIAAAVLVDSVVEAPAVAVPEVAGKCDCSKLVMNLK